jgi:hypothetical protein
VCCRIEAAAQANSRIDSLIGALPGMPEDTAKVRVLTEVGKGTTFRLRLPRELPA